MDSENATTDGARSTGDGPMRRLTIFSLLWLGGAMLCAAASSVVADEPASAEQLAVQTIRAGQARDIQAVKSIAGSLKHDLLLVRRASVWSLSQLPEAAIVPVAELISALADQDSLVRWGAANALGNMGRRAWTAEPALWQAAIDSDAETRCAALIALRTVSVTKPPAAMSVLCQCLQSSSADVSSEAIATVSKLHSRWDDDEKRCLVPHLVSAVETGRDDVRLAAAVLLGDLGLPAAEAIAVLANATDDLDEFIQAAALRAVGLFAEEVDQRWNQLDATQRIALRRPCEIAAKVLGNRGHDSADVVRVAKQFERLTDGIQLISAEESVTLQRSPPSAARAELLPPIDAPSVTTPPSSNRWRWIFVTLLAGLGLWGLRQSLSNRSAGSVQQTSNTLNEAAPLNETSVAEIPTEDIATRRDEINSLSDLALDAAATLNRAMSDEDSVVRWRSASAVTAVHAATVPQLLAAVTSTDPEVRRLAITSLRGLGANALTPFVQALHDDDARMRQAAAVTLGQIGLGAIDAVPQLVTALTDADARVRAAAALSLSTFGPHAMEAVPALRTALSDEFAGVRARAAFALGQIGPSARRAAEELARLVSDPDVSVRSNVVSALGGIGADTAVVLPALRHAMNDEDSGVRRCAAATLAVLDHGAASAAPQQSAINTMINEKVTPQSPHLSSPIQVLLENPLIATADSDGPALKVFDPEQLSEPTVEDDLKSSLDVADFMAQLEDTDADVRWKASLGLEQLGASAVPEMIASLNHRNPAVRKLLIVALGRVGTEARAAMPAMLVALHDVNADVRCAAADCLGHLGVVSRTMIQALVQSLCDPNAEVRRYSATTLGRLGQQAREATTALQIASISDIAVKVRTAAQTALQRISESLVGAA